MDINYTYKNNQTIQNNIVRIETAKRIIEFLPQLPHVEASIRRQSLLKSSLYSARIEGNTLRIEDVQNKRENISQNKEKQEIFNILHALQWIYTMQAPKNLTINLILKLHKMVIQNVSIEAGRLRAEPSAIFNQAGIAIYMTPPPAELKQLIKQLIKLSKSREHSVIKGALVHFSFEKIHPFIDGNGRVGRLLSTLLLKNSGYDFRGLAILEEYLNQNRDEYYTALSITSKDITGFIEFFTDAVAASAEKVISLLQDKKEENPEDTLLPRRQEILAIIREHEYVSFDFIKRRFVRVPESSLHFDLKILMQKGFIKKIGTTRGALYSMK